MSIEKQLCLKCGGAGEVKDEIIPEHPTEREYYTGWESCPNCGGIGYIVNTKAPPPERQKRTDRSRTNRRRSQNR